MKLSMLISRLLTRLLIDTALLSTMISMSSCPAAHCHAVAQAAGTKVKREKGRIR